MALKLSTGLVNKLMDTSPFKTVFAGCFIDIYTGSQPASADDAPTGSTKLVTLYSDGVSAGLSFEASATNGELEKNSAETWSGTASFGIASPQNAQWFRMREAGDAGTAQSTTAARVDGTIGTSGQQMNLGSVSIANGAPFLLSAAVFALPKA